MGTEARVGAKNKGKFGFIEQYSGEAEMFVMPGSGGSGGWPRGDDGDGGPGGGSGQWMSVGARRKGVSGGGRCWGLQGGGGDGTDGRGSGEWMWAG